MELQLLINDNEIATLQKQYRDHIVESPRVRKSEHAWISDQIIERLSGATSQKGGWAVAATLAPTVLQALEPFPLSPEPAKALPVNGSQVSELTTLLVKALGIYLNFRYLIWAIYFHRLESKS
jgi:hypothetical protein